MRKSLRRSLPTAAALATTAALGIGAFTSTAHASPQPAASTAQHQYCATVLAPLQGNQTTSSVLSEKCSTQHAAGSNLPAGFTAAKGIQKIWTGYQYPNYKGQGKRGVWSYFGYKACDRRGYAFNSRQDGWGISSWQAHAGCWHTTIYYKIGYYRDHRNPHFTYRQGVWEAAHIGKASDGRTNLDNHVWSVWTRSR